MVEAVWWLAWFSAGDYLGYNGKDKDDPDSYDEDDVEPWDDEDE